MLAIVMASFGDFIPDRPGPLSILAAIGGLALLLGAMGVMGGGLRRLSGGRARRALEELTGHPWRGVAVGFAVTAIIHSSGVTALMLISLVETGLMKLSAAIPVLLGATVGTTLTGQVLAFRVDWMIPVTLAGGLALKFLVRRDSWKALGESVWGLGLLFLALAIMSAALAPFRNTPSVDELFGWLTRWPVAGFIVGLAVTVLVQSSTASMGILIGLASQGLVPLAGAIHFILGAHVGSCSTGLIATIGKRPEARRVAVVQLLCAGFGGLMFIFWAPSFGGLIRRLSLSGLPAGAGATPHEIANAHTLISLAATFVLLPFAHVLERASRRIVAETDQPRRLFYLDRALLGGAVPAPDMALLQARQAVRAMALQVADLAEEAIQPARETGEAAPSDIHQRVQQIHLVRTDLVGFLSDIGRVNLRRAEVDQGLDMALAANELDSISQACEEALRLHREQDECGPFSPEGQRELEDYRARMLALVRAASEAFLSGNQAAARAVEREKEDSLNPLEERLRRFHLERLQSGVERSSRTDALHLAWLELMRGVTSHAKRLAQVLLERAPASRTG
jgi:phosphate:Na+ symporter